MLGLLKTLDDMEWQSESECLSEEEDSEEEYDNDEEEFLQVIQEVSHSERTVDREQTYNSLEQADEFD